MNSFVTFYHNHFANADGVLKAAQHDIAALANSMGFNGAAVTQALSLAGHELKFDGGKYKLAEHTKNHGRCAAWARIERTEDGLEYPFVTLKFKGDVATFSGLTTIQQAWQEHKAGRQIAKPKPVLPTRKRLLASAQDTLEHWRAQQEISELRQLFPQATAENGCSPYFKKKGISAVCGNIVAKRFTDHHGNFTALPMQSAVVTPNGVEHNPLVGYQRLYDNGGKFQTPALIEGMFKGAYSLIGAPLENHARCTIQYAEGFATAATGYLATQHTTVFCISSSNIINVIRAFTKLYPNAQHVMLADNDHVKQREGKGNAGLRAAFKVKQEFGSVVTVVYPQLDKLDPATIDKVTDFNDLHCYTTGGIKEAAKQINSAGARFELEQDDFLQQCQELALYPAEQAKKRLFKAVAAAVRVGPQKYAVSDTVSIIKLAAQQAGFTPCEKTLAGFYAKLMQKRVEQAHALRSFTQLTTENPRINYREFAYGTQPQTVADYIKRLPKKSVVLFRAPMAFGKTNVIIRQLAEQADYALYTCHRRSLTSGVAEQLNFQHYVDDKADMQQGMIQKTAVCVNSITQSHFDGFFNTYLQDLYIDEASQVLNHVCLGGAIENPLAVWRQLRSAIQLASGKTLLLDADANDLTAKFALQAAGDTPVYVINLAANCSNFTMLHGNAAQVFKAAVDAIAQQNVLLATDSKPKAEQIYESWQQAQPLKKFLLITTDTVGNDDVQEFFKDPSARCRDYHGIAFSPCISSGVSIQTAPGQLPHFQRHFGLFSGQVGPNEAVQMLRRDRDARHFEIGLTTQGKSHQDDPLILLETIRHNLHNSGLLTDSEMAIKVDWNNPALPLTSLSPDPAFELMAVELTAAFNRARNDFANTFLCQLMADNYKVARLDDIEAEAKAGRELAKMARLRIDQKIIDLHLSESTATDEEAAALTQKAQHSGISEQERARLNRHTLEKKLFVPISAETILWLCRDAMQHVNNFELLHAPEQQLHQYVKAQIEAGKGMINVKQVQRKQKALHFLFRQLGIDLATGQGQFTITQAENLLNTLQAKKANIEIMASLGLSIKGSCAGSWATGLFQQLGLKLDKSRRFIDGKKTTVYQVVDKSYVTENGRLTPGWQMLATVYRNRCAAGISAYDIKLEGAENTGHDLAMDLIPDSRIVSTQKPGLYLAATSTLAELIKAESGDKLRINSRPMPADTAAALLPAMLNPAEPVCRLGSAEKLKLFAHIRQHYRTLGEVCEQYQPDYQLLQLMHEYAPTPHVAMTKLPELMQDRAKPVSMRQRVLQSVARQFAKWFSASDIESFEKTITSY